MGKISILTKEQQAFLSVLRQNSYITKNFYFTGGTALSEYYLHHRYSEDIDLFSESKIDTDIINTLVHDWSKKLHFTFSSNFIEVVYRFNCIFKNGYELKVDFAYYPYKRIQPSQMINGLPVDSLFDIAVNKTNTLSQRQSIKDFVDCYFLWQTESFYDLVHGIEIKFHEEFDPMIFSSNLLSVEYFDVLPKMLKPLQLSDLKSYFRKEAVELAKKSVEL